MRHSPYSVTLTVTLWTCSFVCRIKSVLYTKNREHYLMSLRYCHGNLPTASETTIQWHLVIYSGMLPSLCSTVGPDGNANILALFVFRFLLLKFSSAGWISGIWYYIYTVYTMLAECIKVQKSKHKNYNKSIRNQLWIAFLWALIYIGVNIIPFVAFLHPQDKTWIWCFLLDAIPGTLPVTLH